MSYEAEKKVTVGVIVAHPDDETLWVGGTLLLHPEWQCEIMTLCRKNDADRAPRFTRALACYGATGRMADLDDEPAQLPLPVEMLEQTIHQVVEGRTFDLLFTHGPQGEYTRHRRHEEISRAVMKLWQEDRLPAGQLLLFAYADDHGTTYPHARGDAALRTALPPDIQNMKYRIIHEIYGFTADSWEARATPTIEAFWNFTTPEDLSSWLQGLREDL